VRQEKRLLLEEVKEKIEGSDSFVVIRHHGLKAEKAEELRAAVDNVDADFEVVRKRVFIKAAEAAGVDGFNRDILQGSIGIVFAAGDPVTTAKTVVDFGKDAGEMLEVVGGRVDGKNISSADVKRLSEMPSKDQLRAQFCGVLQAPQAQTLGVMHSLLTSVIYAVDNKRKKDSGEE
jgi:large subunit ribosomal protein L10